MCLPVLLFSMLGWAAAASVSQLSAAEGASCSEPSCTLTAEQSVSILHGLHRHVLHPHAALLKKHGGRFYLHRLGDDEDGDVAQHQHRRFGLEASPLRGDVLPVTVARLMGLQQRFSPAAVFAPNGRAPPTR
jgi:hypothetical protein